MSEGKEPGYYPDGKGNLRFWDGSAWTDYVKSGTSGWEVKKGIPLENVPRGAPDGFRDRPPGVPIRFPGASSPAGAGGGLLGCLGIMLLAGFFVAELVRFLGETARELRWMLLVAWVVLAVVVGRAIRTRLREGEGKWLRLTVVWLIVGWSALWGFQEEREEAKHRVPPEVSAIRLARNELEVLSHYSPTTSLELACKGYFPEDHGKEFAALYGVADCATALAKVLKGLPEEFSKDPESVIEKIPMTIVGKREKEFYDWCYRIELGTNPFGWREIEVCRATLTSPNLLRVLKLQES